jgi:hypothetical protein
MKRIAHIQNEKIINVSVGKDDWIAPEDGSMMLESDALSLGYTYFSKNIINYDNAPSWKVKIWLLRNGITSQDISNTIVQIYENMYGENLTSQQELEKQEALLRWENVTEIPFDHPLVGLIANQLNINLENVWNDIHSI